jgi:hypothetical protein
MQSGIAGYRHVTQMRVFETKKAPGISPRAFLIRFDGDPEQIRTADLLLDREAC